MNEEIGSPKLNPLKTETINNFTDSLKGWGGHYLALADGRKVLRTDASSVALIETFTDDNQQSKSILTTVTVDGDKVYKKVYPLEMPIDLDDQSSVPGIIKEIIEQPDNFSLSNQALQNLEATTAIKPPASERAAELIDTDHLVADDDELYALAMSIHDAVGKDVLAQ